MLNINVKKLSCCVLHSDYFPSDLFFIFVRTMERVFYYHPFYCLFYCTNKYYGV